MGDEHVLSDPQTTTLLEVAGDELGCAGRDRRAQDQRVAGAQQRQQIVDGRAHLAQVAFHVGEGWCADRDHDVVGLGRVNCPLGQLEPAGLDDPLEQFLGARLVERHPTCADRFEHRRVVVDAEHAHATVGEAQGKRQAHPPEADDGD